MQRSLVLLAAGFVLLGSAPMLSAGPAPVPAFDIYPAPTTLGSGAAEPTMGVNWATGKAMFQAGLRTLRVTWNTTVDPPTARWDSVAPILERVITLDPFLHHDVRSGRTFVSQLVGACSLMSFTDDDGATWTQQPLGCGAGAMFDHQQIGSGVRAGVFENLDGQGLGYPTATYYCAQYLAAAACAQSPDGGLTWGPGIPAYTLLSCGGLHGQPVTAPDGTLFLPNRNCGGMPAVIVSQDGGLTWTVRRVNGQQTAIESAPAAAVGKDGTLYLCFQDMQGVPRATVSSNNGTTWGPSRNLGTGHGLNESQFMVMLAGDGDRAACAFLGTRTNGDDQSSAFLGQWHLYVSFTYNRGLNWTTYDLTPTDPVQRGCIWMGGGVNPCRNLLDFMGGYLGPDGRVYIAYADGCVSVACRGASGTPNDSRSDLATIARQADGWGLFADEVLGP